MVFTGDEFADGGEIIAATLKRNHVKASFFFTGRFYRNPLFKKLIIKLRKDDHYLGGHSDQHLLYCNWKQRDSMLVTEEQFKEDLRRNYDAMMYFGIEKQDASYFLPPYEWYNSTVAKWTKEEGMQLVNFSPGTRSTADYTYPDMGKSYISSKDIYNSILSFEANAKNGMNGFMLLMHIGTDVRRTDKFYNLLDSLIKVLHHKGYSFEKIDKLLNEGE
ncbi:polysaccharide deacetylase family protein [Arcticibacter tournemirensis]|uniref:polysaccharide deacetylase family protein n=1 Tax=Arcticibacter tournemirensis TaxID=699437 RepID=UPI001F3B585E|nr:polysaccharide deacetylase family protein [Arcticibacter tournemirensis]